MDCLTGADKEISDLLVKSTFLGKGQTTIRLQIKLI